MSSNNRVAGARPVGPLYLRRAADRPETYYWVW